MAFRSRSQMQHTVRPYPISCLCCSAFVRWLVRVSKIFVITGRTVMRKSFDGLMAIIRDKYELDPYANALYCSVGETNEKSKHFTSIKTALYYCKKGLMEAAGSSGPGMLRKPGSWPVRNSAGLWKAFLSISPKRSKAVGKRRIFNILCKRRI